MPVKMSAKPAGGGNWHSWLIAFVCCGLAQACDAPNAANRSSPPTGQASGEVATEAHANGAATSLAAGDKEGFRIRPPVSFADTGLDALFDEAAAEFAANGLGADRPGSPLLETAGRWRAQLDRCVDLTCRETMLDDVRRRLNFGLGRSRDRFAGLPWRVGLFDSASDQGSRHLAILPLGNNRIVVRIRTVSSRWDCELIAAGEVDAGGNGVMHVVGDPWPPGDDPGRFMLRSRSPSQIAIDRIQPAPVHDVCNASHLGDYSARAGRVSRE